MGQVWGEGGGRGEGEAGGRGEGGRGAGGRLLQQGVAGFLLTEQGSGWQVEGSSDNKKENFKKSIRNIVQLSSKVTHLNLG